MREPEKEVGKRNRGKEEQNVISSTQETYIHQTKELEIMGVFNNQIMGNFEAPTMLTGFLHLSS